jgi:hypothetical protein
VVYEFVLVVRHDPVPEAESDGAPAATLVVKLWMAVPPRRSVAVILVALTVPVHVTEAEVEAKPVPAALGTAAE